MDVSFLVGPVTLDTQPKNAASSDVSFRNCTSRKQWLHASGEKTVNIRALGHWCTDETVGKRCEQSTGSLDGFPLGCGLYSGDESPATNRDRLGPPRSPKAECALGCLSAMAAQCTVGPQQVHCVCSWELHVRELCCKPSLGDEKSLGRNIAVRMRLVGATFESVSIGFARFWA